MPHGRLAPRSITHAVTSCVRRPGIASCAPGRSAGSESGIRAIADFAGRGRPTAEEFPAPRGFTEYRPPPRVRRVCCTGNTRRGVPCGVAAPLLAQPFGRAGRSSALIGRGMRPEAARSGVPRGLHRFALPASIQPSTRGSLAGTAPAAANPAGPWAPPPRRHRQTDVRAQDRGPDADPARPPGHPVPCGAARYPGVHRSFSLCHAG